MKRYIRSSEDSKSYQVDIVLKDGTKEYFDTFVSKEWAQHNIAFAQAAPDSIYAEPKYDGAKWIITEQD